MQDPNMHRANVPVKNRVDEAFIILRAFIDMLLLIATLKNHGSCK
jgi:hypothetical protein